MARDINATWTSVGENDSPDDTLTLTWQGHYPVTNTDFENEKIWDEIRELSIDKHQYQTDRHEIEIQIMCEDMGL